MSQGNVILLLGIFFSSCFPYTKYFLLPFYSVFVTLNQMILTSFQSREPIYFVYILQFIIENVKKTTLFFKKSNSLTCVLVRHFYLRCTSLIHEGKFGKFHVLFRVHTWDQRVIRKSYATPSTFSPIRHYLSAHTFINMLH